ncbi:chitinase D domain protein, partial [Vibrio parahaemolyticus V-223/04]
QTLTY